MTIETMDFLLAQKNLAVIFLDDKEYHEWVWQETFPNGATLCVHGEGPNGYTRDDAYEDAFRNALGLDPIADEIKIKH
jgi:hypothetical protein